MAHLSIVPYEDNPSHIESHLMFKAFVVNSSVNYRLCCRLYNKLSHILALKHLLREFHEKRDIASVAIIPFITSIFTFPSILIDVFPLLILPIPYAYICAPSNLHHYVQQSISEYVHSS